MKLKVCVEIASIANTSVEDEIEIDDQVFNGMDEDEVNEYLRRPYRPIVQ